MKLVKGHSQPGEAPQIESQGAKFPDLTLTLHSLAKAPNYCLHPTGNQKAGEAGGRVGPLGQPPEAENRKEGGQWTQGDKEQMPHMVVSPEHVSVAVDEDRDLGSGCASGERLLHLQHPLDALLMHGHASLCTWRTKPLFPSSPCSCGTTM